VLGIPLADASSASRKERECNFLTIRNSNEKQRGENEAGVDLVLIKPFLLRKSYALCKSFMLFLY